MQTSESNSHVQGSLAQLAERRSHTLYDPVEHWRYPKVVSSSLTIPITFVFASSFSVSTSLVECILMVATNFDVSRLTKNISMVTVIPENVYYRRHKLGLGFGVCIYVSIDIMDTNK